MNNFETSFFDRNDSNTEKRADCCALSAISVDKTEYIVISLNLFFCSLESVECKKSLSASEST